MNTLRSESTQGTGKRRWRRPTSASLVSVVMHVVLGILVWNAMQMPMFFDQVTQAPVAERIQYVEVTPSGGREAVSPPPRGSTPTRAQPATAAPPQVVPLVAPREVPTQLPPPATGAIPSPDVNPLRGGNGPTRGVQPNTDDPRLWTNPEFIYAPKTDKERLDSALITSLARHIDSVNATAYSPNKFERGDWTVGKGGNKWGVDPQFIRLGPISIPTAILALLPMNQMQTNPISLDRDRNAAYMRADIFMHAQAAMNEEQFRKAVKAIRDRKERERKAKGPVIAGPIASPGERPPPP